MWGMCKAFDEYDTGDERTGLRLPSGEYDIYLGFQDLQFDSKKQIFFNVFDTDGHLGDRIAVNGKIHPKLQVKPRRYRFRLLNSSPSRFYQFFLCKGDSNGNFKLTNNTWEKMMMIANDGNLLEKPYAVPANEGLLMAVANRFDVVIDFAKYAGQTLYLVNRLHQDSGRGPSFELLNPGTAVLKIVVDKDMSANDDSLPVDPEYPVGAGIQRITQLRALPPIDMAEVKANRSWRFDRLNGAWTVNSQIVDLKTPRCTPKQGTAEVWTISNNSGSWSHPVHIHFEEFQILSRNGRTPPPYEKSRKDVLLLRPNEEVKIFIRFRDFLGQYVMHCHNVVHEDHAMMIRFDIVPSTAT
jgi:FtsP/CotA-like multicopper oxidase with cupredoxin domain